MTDHAVTEHRTQTVSAPGAPQVVGFDPRTRTWWTTDDGLPPAGCVAPPELDGELVVDPRVRRSVGTDLGGLVRRVPSAVLQPLSTADVAAMVRFCRGHGLGVGVRGRAHTTFGQGLTDGVLIENRHLRRIHSVGPDSVEVDAGITWKELASATVPDGLTPPVLTGYTGLTVGGTLSVGGIGGLVGGLRTGLQVDHVRELEVVTGTGAVVRCSERAHRDLFEAALGGLGRCGVITRAVLDLAPAPARAATRTTEYAAPASFFRDLYDAIESPSVDHVYGEFFLAPEGPLFLLHSTSFHDGTPPRPIGDGAAGKAEVSVTERTFLEHAFAIDDAIDELAEAVGWNNLLKPWFDVWLPGTTVERQVTELVTTLTPDDIGAYGAGLIYPQRRSLAGRPFPRLPEPDGSEWAFVLDVNTVSSSPDPGPEYARGMLARNRRLFARARDAHGARLYPIGSVPFDESDWRHHYGPTWDAVLAAKHRHDPDGVLGSWAALPVPQSIMARATDTTYSP